MSGRITEIQRFSLNDGYGIRTAVFFAGCNLHCDWCHNPESIPTKPRLMHYAANCIGCGKCVQACERGVHSFGEAHAIDRDKCVMCGKCVDICFAGALRSSSREVEADEVMREILQDKPYYDNSCGGVTLTGGEVFLQPEFADEITDACREAGIAVACETNLCWSFDKIAPILRKMSLIMFDVKIFDPALHRLHTGADNRIILENAKRLGSLGIPLIARTPLIPTATDSKANLSEIAAFLSGIPNLQKHELLEFNPLGGVKYDALGLENRYGNQERKAKA